MTLLVKWVDGGRDPQCAPDPAYPLGMDIEIGMLPDAPACKASLQYPAPRCGYHYVECSVCGTSAAITTAGRPDDPRSVRLPCKLAKGVH